MRRALNRFVSIYDDIYHVTQLGISNTSPPADLFVQTCMLYCVACVKDSTFPMPREQRHSIYALMDRQYVIMIRADPSRDLALGLLILSFSPLPQLEHNVIYADPFRSAVLAYNMAADLGLEESMRKLRSLRPTEITWNFYEKLLRDLGLVSCEVERMCARDGALMPMTRLAVVLDFPPVHLVSYAQCQACNEPSEC